MSYFSRSALWFSSYHKYMSLCRLREGLKGVLNMSKFGNQYIQSNQPWVLVKGSESDRYASLCLKFAVLKMGARYPNGQIQVVHRVDNTFQSSCASVTKRVKCETFHLKMSSACSFIFIQIESFSKELFPL